MKIMMAIWLNMVYGYNHDHHNHRYQDYNHEQQDDDKQHTTSSILADPHQGDHNGDIIYIMVIIYVMVIQMCDLSLLKHEDCR